MSLMQFGLRTHLAADQGVAALFTDEKGCRIFCDHIPDEQAYPFAKISVVSEPTDYTQDGEGLRRGLYQVDVYDDEAVACATAAEAIRSAVSGYRGMMGSIHVGRAFVTDVRGEWDATGRHYREVLEVDLGAT